MTDGSPNVTRRRRKQHRPAEIIDAGLAVFGLKGFEAARMADIAERAGVAKGTLFRYFPTKEALFAAAVTSRVSPVFEQGLALLDSHVGPSLPLLRMLVDTMYLKIDADDLTPLMRVIIAEGHRFPAILELYHRESIALGQALLTRIIDRGVASGEFRASAMTELPLVMMAPAVMGSIWRMTFDAVQPLPLEAFHAAHWAMLCATLGVETGGG